MKLKKLVKEDYQSDMKAAKDAEIKAVKAQQQALDKKERAYKAKEAELKKSTITTETIEDLPDQEGRMAKTQLYTIIHHAHEVYKSLDNEQQLPAWWQSHLAKAEDLILQMHSYFTFEKDQESEKEK